MGEYTKAQMLNLFAAWNIDAQWPSRKRDVLIAFPRPASPNVARISYVPRQPQRIVNGSYHFARPTLYRVTWSNE